MIVEREVFDLLRLDFDSLISQLAQKQFGSVVLFNNDGEHEDTYLPNVTLGSVAIKLDDLWGSEVLETSRSEHD